MDKNIIKRYLTERFLTEVAEGGKTPGISVTNAVNKKSGEINKAGVKAIDKDVKAYDKDLKKGGSEVKDNKFNYNSTEELEYHNDMEIMNGQEMIEYDREPTQTFLDKAKEAIVGSSRMGNKGGKDMGNAEASQGASSDSFGKNFVKRVKATTKKREEASDSVMSFGDDVETVPKGSIPKGKHSAIQENKDELETINEYNPYGSEEENEFNNKEKTENPELKENDNSEDEYDKQFGSYRKAVLARNNKQNKDNNDNPKIKESMKRLKFKKEFNGVGNALKMIPESYRVDNKEFEMTDGNESYTIRWEGTLTEGKATVLKAANKNMINEDMQRMKHLMGYSSQETLGTVKGRARINENAVFTDIWNKSKVLLGESEEIDGQTAPEDEWDDISVPQAADAKKDIEGSVPTEAKTNAPAPKEGEWEEISVPQAADAKKHVEGSVATEAKTNAPAPKEGNWEEINVPQAADAKKDINEGEEEEDVDYTMGSKDKNQLPNPKKEITIDETEEEETEEEEVIDEAIKLMVSESTGKLYVVGATDKPFAVPAIDNAKALRNPKKYISEVFNVKKKQ